MYSHQNRVRHYTQISNKCQFNICNINCICLNYDQVLFSIQITTSYELALNISIITHMILNKKNPNSQKSQPIKGTPLADIPSLIT